MSTWSKWDVSLPIFGNRISGKKFWKIFEAQKNSKIFFCSNFEMLKFFSKIFKNRKISKCSKIDYFSSIFLKRAYYRKETILCRFLTKTNLGKFFEKFSTPRNIIKNQHFPPKNRRCAWCATCVHIRHMCLRASKIKLQHHTFSTSHLGPLGDIY